MKRLKTPLLVLFYNTIYCFI